MVMSILLAAVSDAVGGTDSSLDQSRSRISISTENNLGYVAVSFSIASFLLVCFMIWRYRTIRNECLSDMGASRPLPAWMANRDFRVSDGLVIRRKRRSNSTTGAGNASAGDDATGNGNDVSESEGEHTPDEMEEVVDPMFAKMTVPFEERSIFWVTLNMLPGTSYHFIFKQT